MSKNSHDHDADVDLDQPLPRYTKRRRRPPEDRGLPPDEELMRLAEAYLSHQGKLCPEMVKAGLLAKPQPGVISEMVDDFKHRHRTGDVNIALVMPLINRKLKLAGNYDRYSCDNSNAHSIIDQMINALDKAHSEKRFIPWSYIFADYAISGLDPARRGFASYRLVLESPELQVETTYVDDVTRAGRDDMMWWKFAAMLRRLRKRLIGASDGFDLSSPQGEAMMYVYLLVSRYFIKQLREKVKRGMHGGARRKTCLGKPPLGITRRVKRNADGTIERNPDGTPVHEWCIDPATVEFALLMFDLYVVKHWSPGRIAKHFNQLKVEGWDGWSESGIRDMLRNPAYIGVIIWNRTRREYDEEKEQFVVVKNPRSEWDVYFNRSLALISMDWWRAAQRKLSESRRKNNRSPRSRNQSSATTLFSGTLVCDYCGHELTLNRSAGKFKSMHCLNGPHEAHGCKLRSSKSTAIIEKCLLKYLQDVVLTEEAVNALVGKANAYLTEEAARPRADVTQQKSDLRQKEAAITKLFKRVQDSEDTALCSAYDKRIAQLTREADELRGEIRDLNIQNAEPPKPLNLKDVKRYVSDLRGVLNQEIPAAAEAIRTLTGPIKVSQEPIPGRKVGARWIAKFSPNLTNLLAKIARERDYPDSITLEFLSRRIWITPEKLTVVIHDVPKYEEQAPVFLEMQNAGASINAIASAHQMSSNCVKEILKFAETGVRPDWAAVRSKSSKRRPCSSAGDGSASATPAEERGHHVPKYQAIAPEVVKLRERKGLSFDKIRQMLGVARHTVNRAYDFARPGQAQAALDAGERPDRGTVPILGTEKYEKMRKLLAAGEEVSEIAKVVGCGKSTVYRERKRLKHAG